MLPLFFSRILIVYNECQQERYHIETNANNIQQRRQPRMAHSIRAIPETLSLKERLITIELRHYTTPISSSKK
jgi:hypothetical protein